MAWVPRGDNDYCATHDYEWDRVKGVKCPLCTKAKLKPPDPESDFKPALPPEGCRSSAEFERWLTEGATFYHGQAQKLAGGVREGRGRPNFSAAQKYAETALKYARAALEIVSTRERREWVKYLKKTNANLRKGAKR